MTLGKERRWNVFIKKKKIRLAHTHNNSLRKQSTFRDASTVFPAKRRLSTEIPYYNASLPRSGGASD